MTAVTDNMDSEAQDAVHETVVEMPEENAVRTCLLSCSSFSSRLLNVYTAFIMFFIPVTVY